MFKSIIFLGPPGCGKGTQSSAFKKEKGFLQVSTGELLRQALEENTETSAKLKEILDAGELVPDEIVNKIIKEFCHKNKAAKGIIFDGYPRNTDQATELESILGQFNAKIDHVFYFDVVEDTIIKRVAGRFTCANCGIVYNTFFNSTKIDNECDYCHSHEFKKRDDDNEDIVKHRLDIYKKSTEPLLKYYEDNLIRINAEQPINLVSAEIMKYL